MSLFSKLILLISGFLVFICRASRICSRSLSISCAIIVVFSTRIFRNLDLGIEWFLSYPVLSNSASPYFCYGINFQLKKKQTNTPYTSKQSLMMTYERFKSVRYNFGKFIDQFQPETKTLIWKLERILNKLYRQNLSLLFNETGLNKEDL